LRQRVVDISCVGGHGDSYCVKHRVNKKKMLDAWRVGLIVGAQFKKVSRWASAAMTLPVVTQIHMVRAVAMQCMESSLHSIMRSSLCAALTFVRVIMMMRFVFLEAYDLPLPWVPCYLVIWDPVDILRFI
jgi:hypothetical protein